jgi:hypothetical protein
VASCRGHRFYHFGEEIVVMTTTLRASSNGQPRKTLASQLDRLDGILDGLDAALAGAVQEAVGLAVKEAVQAVLTEVLTNRPLQEQLRPAASTDSAAAESRQQRPSLPQRLGQAAAKGLRWTVQTVRQAGRRVGLVLLAAAGLTAGVAYAARRRLASATAAVCHVGKRVLGGTVTALTRVLPSFAFGVR